MPNLPLNFRIKLPLIAIQAQGRYHRSAPDLLELTRLGAGAPNNL